MKFILIAIFLILTHQLRIQKHQMVYPTDPDKPLDGHIFIMVKNYLNDEQLNGYIFYFNHSGFDFRGCNHNWGLYTAGKDGSFSVSTDFMHTLHHCKEDKDKLVQKLMVESTSYKLDGDNLILSGPKGDIKFVPWKTG